MTCAEHNRAHCPEPRCHVLAVCRASLHDERRAHIESGQRGVWLEEHGYLAWEGEQWVATLPSEKAVAARLVAWMRSRWTTRRPGPLRILVDGAVPEGVWAEFGPGHYHALDEVLPYAERVKALTGPCDHKLGKMPIHEIRRHLGSPECGVNWATVAVLLDAMQDMDIGLDVVHEWRPSEKTRSEAESLDFTDQDFQVLARSWPFAWTDLREAAEVWREWVGSDMSRDQLTACCSMAVHSGMSPRSYADAMARSELESRNARP